MHVEERVIETRLGPRVIAIGTPSRRGVLDRNRLERMRRGELKSRANDFLIAALAARTTPVHAIVFRAGAEGGGHNEIAEDISDEEVIEYGRWMVAQQLDLYERAARHGVRVLVGIEFGQREVMGYDKGSARLAEELEFMLADPQAYTPAELAEARLRLWLVDHLATWTGTSLEPFLDEKLPAALVAAERSGRALQRLLQDLDVARARQAP